MRAAGQRFVASGTKGVIVNNASVIGWRAQEGQAHYAAAKAGVMALTRCSALDLAPHGIRVNAVLPGVIDTPLGVDEIVRRTGAAREDVMAARAAIVPMGRQGTAWDVAQAALFFASDDSSFVTGQLVVIDDGLTLIVGPVPANAR